MSDTLEKRLLRIVAAGAVASLVIVATFGFWVGSTVATTNKSIDVFSVELSEQKNELASLKTEITSHEKQDRLMNRQDFLDMFPKSL